MAKTEIKTTLKPNLSLVEPPMFKIIYLNDEVTSMEFVVSTLIEYFNYTDDTAVHITQNINSQGSAVVAV